MTIPEDGSKSRKIFSGKKLMAKRWVSAHPDHSKGFAAEEGNAATRTGTSPLYTRESRIARARSCENARPQSYSRKNASAKIASPRPGPERAPISELTSLAISGPSQASNKTPQIQKSNRLFKSSRNQREEKGRKKRTPYAFVQSSSKWLATPMIERPQALFQPLTERPSAQVIRA